MKLLSRFRAEFGKQEQPKPRRKLRKATSRRTLARGAFHVDADRPIFQQIREGKR